MIDIMSRWAVGIAGIAVMSCALTSQAQTSADAANPIGRFEIVRYEVQGNTLLEAPEVDRLLMPFTGKERDFGSVQKAMESLEAAYRQKGYNIVRVVLPEQELNRGVVRLRVMEARIGTVKVQGNHYFDEANIRRSVPGLQEGKTPNVAEVSESLRSANENPAKKTTLHLQSGQQDEQVDAQLDVVDQKPWTAGVSIDNTGDEKTGRNRLTVLYQNDNIGGKDHVGSLQYTTSLANPSEVSVFGAGYHIPLYALGDSLDFYASHSDVNSGIVTAGVFDLAVSGKGSVFGARYSHNLARVGDYDSKVIAGFDYKAFQNDVSLQGLPLGGDVTVHPFSISYVGERVSGLNNFNFYLSGFHNVPGGSNGDSASFAAARVGAGASYSLLRYGATYQRALPQDWQFRFALNGQFTEDALVPGEQFGAGGASSVRGFEEREIADDNGRATNLELYTPNLCGGGAQCRVLAFYDTGFVWRNNVQPGEIADQSIGSFGLGLRASVSSYLVVQTDFAHVVDGTALSTKGSNRVHFRAVLSY